LRPAFDSEDPEGAFGEVLGFPRDDRGRIKIVLGPEKISAAYKEFELRVQHEDIDELEDEASLEATESTDEPNTQGSNPLDDVKRHLQCTGKVEPPKATLEMKLGRLKPELEISLKDKRFRFELKGTPEFSADFKASGKAECSPTYLPKLSIPLLHAPPVFLEIGPIATARLDGHIKASVDWSPEITVGAEKGGRNGTVKSIWEPLAAPTNLPEPEAAGSVKADLGVEVGVSLAKTLAISAKLGPSLEIEHHLVPGPACTEVTASVYAELSGKVNLFLRRWLLTLAREHLVERQFPEDAECPRGSSTHGAGGHELGQLSDAL
jgi:hypothetical protein